MTDKKTDKKSGDVTIYPTGDAHIPDVPAVEQTVSAKRAKELLAYSPPAFTTTKPKAPAETVTLDERGAESVAVPGDTAVAQPTETPPADDAGTSTQEA